MNPIRLNNKNLGKSMVEMGYTRKRTLWAKLFIFPTVFWTDLHSLYFFQCLLAKYRCVIEGRIDCDKELVCYCWWWWKSKQVFFRNAQQNPPPLKIWQLSSGLIRVMKMHFEPSYEKVSLVLDFIASKRTE